VESESIGAWLGSLASSAPAPGGGGAAALQVAMGAALVEMVCNLTAGRPAYAEHEDEVQAILAEAGELRANGLVLADEDAVAFEAVIAAYRMPKDTHPDAEARNEAIQSALIDAAEVARSCAAAAVRVIELAEQIVPIGNANVISDAAAGAGAARAAAQTSLLNIDANVGSLDDVAIRERFTSYAAHVSQYLGRADAVVESVRVRASG
jgi:formiminotetrahydrofolate cyclodeaminase